MPAVKRVYAPKKTSVVAKRPKRPTYQKPAISGISAINNRSSLGTEAYVSFTYLEFEWALNSPFGVGGLFQFNLSSLHDPNLSGVGHQPTNYDQLMLLFEHYIVTECEYKIALRKSPGEDRAQLVAVNICDQIPTSVDARNYVENGMTEWKVIEDDFPIAYFTGNVDLAKVHGVTRKQLLSSAAYQGAVGSGPSDAVILTAYMNTLNAGVNSSCLGVCELRFKAVLRGTKLNLTS